MYNREMRVKIGEKELEDDCLNKILMEERERVMVEFEKNKKGDEALINRCKGQLVDKLDKLMELYKRENVEKKRKNEKYMGELVNVCSKVSDKNESDE